jgi:chromate transport protein ChrA
MTPQPAVRDVIPLAEATRTWFAISLQTFGGPAGQIAVMQRILVDEKRWIGQRRFLFALGYCTLLPGPEAQQLATYVGWLLNGVRGALIAGILFVLPGVVSLLALSALYVGYGETGLVEALFVGIAPAVIAIVVQAVLAVSKRGLNSRTQVGLAYRVVPRAGRLRGAVPGRRAGCGPHRLGMGQIPAGWRSRAGSGRRRPGAARRRRRAALRVPVEAAGRCDPRDRPAAVGGARSSPAPC